MDKLFVGKIVGFHGVKGELKVVTDFQMKEKVFVKNNDIIIGEETFKITSVRIHKNNYLITLNGMLDLNLVDKYIKSDVFYLRDNLSLTKDEFLYSDLIGFKVMDCEKEIGTVNSISHNNVNVFLEVKGEKKFLIPFIEVFVGNVDLDNKIVETINGGELII
ncbi:MAG: ribosome maturation factor RimM [bacterium]